MTQSIEPGDLLPKAHATKPEEKAFQVSEAKEVKIATISHQSSPAPHAAAVQAPIVVTKDLPVGWKITTKVALFHGTTHAVYVDASGVEHIALSDTVFVDLKTFNG